ncbi:hypothetical protein CEUSTIGMA_g6153.t1 [Chlamydomonas eustigma]|uniref:NAD-dependent epimerase/dehydratase domain-containing protein n=1 Tax=Chlamydomonas eustigma TaxID=1157962 RepID=A0A250X6M3_9CHLO|nr:hypothetical protein CEUSTIGMA_g6153.t1 [Chlamydomonas eustigma]|eukprot:GAX78715.1 hypothetical protein CEUSTIGMA_g6153.t1 [Chlamydomonas eustigma]
MATRAPSTVCQASSEKMSVAITGATGFVGSRLTAKLASQGHKVKVLTRDVSKAKSKLPYPGVEVFGPADWSKAIAGATGVVNLAGEPIATRWTPELKSQIMTSRIGTTRKLVDALNALPEGSRPRVFVSSSAIGYYGVSQTASFNEDSTPITSDYLSQVCVQWEAAASAAPKDVRTVILRTGIVLAREGGALAKMLPIFQIFAGGPLGTGKQWMSWIHRDDLVELIVDTLQNTAYVGVFNATAPKPVRMAEFCSTLGALMGRPSWLPVPDFALNTLLGEGAMVVLEGQKVLPTKTQQVGFNFKYSDISTALKSVL